MLKIYQRLWQVTWAEQWQYRANSVMYLFYWLVSPVVYLAVWTTIARAQGSVSGLTPNDFVIYYMVLLIIDQFTSDITIYNFAFKVQDGTLSNDLIRPIHPMLTTILVNNIAFKALTLMALMPVWALLWFLFQPDFTGVTWQGMLLAVPAIIIGFLINFLLNAALACVAFWTTRVWALHEFFMALGTLFSGQFVPLTLMPPLIQSVARFLPFQLTKYFLIELVLGRLAPADILQGYLMGLLWLAISLAIFIWAWTNGVKKFSAVGA